MTELINVVKTWQVLWPLVAALILFALVPGIAMRLLVRIYPKNDPRREQLVHGLWKDLRRFVTWARQREMAFPLFVLALSTVGFIGAVACLVAAVVTHGQFITPSDPTTGASPASIVAGLFFLVATSFSLFLITVMVIRHEVRQPSSA